MLCQSEDILVGLIIANINYLFASYLSLRPTDRLALVRCSFGDNIEDVIAGHGPVVTVSCDILPLFIKP